MCWRSVIVTTCKAIPLLGCGSNIGCTLADVACICRVASVWMLIVPSFAATNRSNMRRNRRRLRGFVMMSRYTKLTRPLSSLVVQLVIRISPKASMPGSMIATLSFYCIVMHQVYSLAGITWNFRHPTVVQAKSLCWDPRFGARAEKILLPLRSDASCICILLL